MTMSKNPLVPEAGKTYEFFYSPQIKKNMETFAFSMGLDPANWAEGAEDCWAWGQHPSLFKGKPYNFMREVEKSAEPLPQKDMQPLGKGTAADVLTTDAQFKAAAALKAVAGTESAIAATVRYQRATGHKLG